MLIMYFIYLINILCFQYQCSTCQNNIYTTVKMHNFNMECLVQILILQKSREGWRGEDTETEAKNVKETRAAMLIFK